MTVAFLIRRAGPALWSWLVVLWLLSGLTRAVDAQVPDTLPPDTVAADTVRLPIPPEAMVEDTVPTDSIAQDSAVPVPPFPRYERPGRGGFAHRRWSWNRQQLLRYHSLSLLQLLQRVPGLAVLRMGDFGQPAGISTLGGGGGRVRVFLDGFEVDPLGFASYELQHIALGSLESVRVERSLDGVRVDLIPMRLPDDRPISAVEAATGVYDTKLLRGLLMRGIGRRTVLTAAFDQASSRGVRFDQEFSYRAGRAAVSYALGQRTALQVEYRSETAESGVSAVPVDANRRTLLLRGRSELWPGLVVDAVLGQARRRPEEQDPLDVDLASTQAAFRAAYDVGPLWLEGAARLRTNADSLGLPGSALEARAGVQLQSWIMAEGELRTGDLLGVAGTRGHATVRMGPLASLSAFATVGFGEQALPLVRDTTIEYPVGDPDDQQVEERVEPRFTAVSASAGGVRVGGDWSLASGTIGAAAVLLPEGVVAPFGFPMLDRGSSPVEVGVARGFEAYTSLPVPLTREYVRLEGWYSWWSDLSGRPYVPAQEGRLALQAHGIFYGGDFEPSLRIEAARRGAVALPELGPDEPAAVTNPYSVANLQLEIRILDVRAFFVFDNFTNILTAQDFAGRPLPSTRFYYGLRWTFRN